MKKIALVIIAMSIVLCISADAQPARMYQWIVWSSNKRLFVVPAARDEDDVARQVDLPRRNLLICRIPHGGCVLEFTEVFDTR